MANNLTSNLNMLSPQNFKVVIDDKNFATIAFFCTQANVPGLQSSEINTNYRNFQGFTPGELLDYSTFDVTFIVDEEMKNYIEIRDWLLKNTHGQNLDTRGAENTNALDVIREQQRKDITLSILSNKATTNKEILFNDCFPTTLGELQFTTQDTTLDYLTCTVSFRFNGFSFVK